MVIETLPFREVSYNGTAISYAILYQDLGEKIKTT